MATRIKDKHKIMENQLTFDFFKIPNEIKRNKIYTIFRKQFVSVKKNHIKKYRRDQKF